MTEDQMKAAGLRVERFDIAAALGELRRATDLTIVPAFLVSIDDPGQPGPLTTERARFAHFNAPMIEATGLSAGVTLQELLPPRMAASVLKNYHRAISTEGPISYLEDIPTPSGKAAWNTTIRAVRTPDGAVFAILGSSSDITDIRQRELRDAAQIARLRRTADEVRVFSAMAAHDVRSPLATIDSLVELILEDFFDADDGKRELIEQLSFVTRSARKHMDELLLHCATFEELAPIESVVDLEHLCRDLAAMTDPNEEIGITHPEATILCDRVALHLVLRNLLTNARRHCRERISIDVQNTASEPDLLRFLVSDDGLGFPAGFDPFDVCDETRSATGHGYGLAAVKYVVETRGGRVRTAPSAFGEGAGVAFTMPARMVQGSSSETLGSAAA